MTLMNKDYPDLQFQYIKMRFINKILSICGIPVSFFIQTRFNNCGTENWVYEPVTRVPGIQGL
jgi:hypothetical protein